MIIFRLNILKFKDILLNLNKMKTKEKPVILENYDGKKAYFSSTRYHVLELYGVKYAFPNPTEQIELSGFVSDDEFEKRFPIFQITD